MKNLLRSVGLVVPSLFLFGACAGADSIDEPPPTASATESLSFPSGSGCSTAQQNTLRADEALAAKYLAAIGNQAYNILFNYTANSNRRVLQNFNPYSAEWFSVFNNYNLIRGNLSNTSYLCRSATHPDCSGNFSTAYARTDKAGSQVRICPPYFTAATANRPRILIHEASHQNRNSDNGVGTDDGYTASEFQFPSVHNAFGYEFYSDLCYNGLCWP